MITEDFVSFETSKLLKENGFRELCSNCYGTDVRHNGVSITFDEELDLKGEGRGDEIEYIEGGTLMCGFSCNNSDEDVYAAPTLYIVMKWLLQNNALHIEATPYPHEDGVFYWGYKIAFLDADTLAVMVVKKAAGFGTKELAINEAIKYCLENLI